MNRKYCLGFTTCVGLFIPLFGQSLSLFGVHNRLLGLLMLIGAALGGVKYYQINYAQLIAFVIYLMLFLLMILYSNSSQVSHMLLLEFDRTNYYGSKLSIVFLFTVIPAITSVILSSIVSTKAFLGGFLMGMLLITIMVIIVSINSSEYWFTNDYSVISERNEIQSFSRIGITTLHLIGILVSLKYILLGERKAISIGLFILNFIFIIVYSQRSAWIYIALIIVYLVLIGSNKKLVKKLKITCFLMSILIAGLIVGQKVGAFTDSVIGYGGLIIDGALFGTRKMAYTIAWDGFVSNPIGHGFGSFYKSNNYYSYPHNIVLESLYEMGVIGGMVMLAFLVISIKCVNSVLYFGWKCNNREIQVIGLLFGYVLVLVLKSGDLTSIDALVSLTILLSTVKYKKNQPFKK